MRGAEYGLKLSLRVHHQHGRGMVDVVAAVGSRRARVENTQCAGQFFDFCEIAAYADHAVTKRVDIGPDYLRRVSARVDADKHQGRQVAGRPIGRQATTRHHQLLQRHRANIRAVCETEKYQAPLAGECVPFERPAVLVNKCKLGQQDWLLKHSRAQRCRRWHKHKCNKRADDKRQQCESGDMSSAASNDFGGQFHQVRNSSVAARPCGFFPGVAAT